MLTLDREKTIEILKSVRKELPFVYLNSNLDNNTTLVLIYDKEKNLEFLVENIHINQQTLEFYYIDPQTNEKIDGILETLSYLRKKIIENFNFKEDMRFQYIYRTVFSIRGFRYEIDSNGFITCDYQ